MRIELARYGVGGNDETWHYLEFDEKEGEFYLVREWDNLNLRNLRSDTGEERVKLSEAAKTENSRFRYDLAVEAIKKNLFCN